ncbi:CdaR family protein [Geobacter grbiciae]|uniref:CdaR family protein n=1 Tax=Geobacter grbiciae TaxID=155042 RepID=UPI001FECBE68|nr:CdaR family protein [Geobacter grbiciae]
MAVVMNWSNFSINWDLKLLSLILAVIVWGGVSGGRTAELELTVPLELRNLPPGLSVASAVPTEASVTVAGPKILLLKLRSERIIIPLDARGVGEGTTLFTGLERRLGLPREATITRLFPATVELRLIRSKTVQKP